MPNAKKADDHSKEKRDRKVLEKRRFKAAKMFSGGKTQADIVGEFGVSRTAAHKWHAAWKKKGKRGLASKGHPGQETKLTPKRLAKAKKILLKGAKVAGYADDFWTLERLAASIGKKLRMKIGTTQTWRILRSLNWTPQKPETRYRERDEKKIEHWKKVTWHGIQKRGLK